MFCTVVSPQNAYILENGNLVNEGIRMYSSTPRYVNTSGILPPLRLTTSSTITAHFTHFMLVWCVLRKPPIAHFEIVRIVQLSTTYPFLSVSLSMNYASCLGLYSLSVLYRCSLHAVFSTDFLRLSRYVLAHTRTPLIFWHISRC